MAPNGLKKKTKKKHKAAGTGVNGSKWTHTKQMDAQIRRRVGMASPSAWVNGSKCTQKRHKAADTGVNGSKWTHTKQMDAQIRRLG